MKICQLIIMLLIIFNKIGYTQENTCITDYVVKISGDTIFGKIKYCNEVSSCYKIIFIDTNNKKTKFKPNEVTAYKRDHELFFGKTRPAEIGNH